MLKLAVVGLGGIGIQHLRAISKSSNCSIGAVCDINEELAKNISVEYSAPYFTNYKDIINLKEIDAVIINLPHFLHCETTVFFLEHGFHVLIEKPMANTVSECEKMISAAKSSNRKLAVGHVQRFFAANSEVKKAIKSEKFGKLCMFTEFRTINYFDSSRPKWFLNKDTAGGGIVMNYGAHAPDKLFYVLEEENAEIVSSYGNIKNNENIEGHAQFMAKFQSAVSATVTFSGYAGCGYDSVYYFTKGALKVSDTNFLSCNFGGDWEEVDINSDNDNAMLLQIDEFCKYVNGEDADIADGEYGKNIIAIIEKIYG